MIVGVYTTNIFSNKSGLNTIIPTSQQQKVISSTIDSVLNFARKIEFKNPKFHFGGLAWDVPNPTGDF